MLIIQRERRPLCVCSSLGALLANFFFSQTPILSLSCLVTLTRRKSSCKCFQNKSYMVSFAKRGIAWHLLRQQNKHQYCYCGSLNWVWQWHSFIHAVGDGYGHVERVWQSFSFILKNIMGKDSFHIELDTTAGFRGPTRFTSLPLRGWGGWGPHLVFTSCSPAKSSIVEQELENTDILIKLWPPNALKVAQ